MERAAAGDDATDNPGQKRGEAAERATSDDRVRAAHWSLRAGWASFLGLIYLPEGV